MPLIFSKPSPPTGRGHRLESGRFEASESGPPYVRYRPARDTCRCMAAASHRFLRRRLRRSRTGADRLFSGFLCARWFWRSGYSTAQAAIRAGQPCVAPAGAGWWMGFGYFVAGLWWLGSAFLAEADRFAWALPLGVLGLPAGLAIFTAFGFLVARLMWSPGAARIFALAAGLSVSEWLRGHVLTGFPWNDFGMVLGGNLIFAQAASIFGLYGLTVLSVLIFASPALAGRRQAKPARFQCCRRTAPGCVGGFRPVSTCKRRLAKSRTAKLRVVQPNIPLDDFRRRPRGILA